MSEEIKATQENTRETRKGFAELKKALIEQNEKSAERESRQRQAAEEADLERLRQIGIELKTANATDKRRLNRERIEVKESREKRKLEIENLKSQKSSEVTTKKSLDLDRQTLESMRKQIEDSGGVAEDNLQFRRTQNKIRRQELALRKSQATSPAARKEIRKEQRAELINAFKLAIAPVSERIGGLVNTFKSIGSIGTGVPGLSLGRLAFLAALPFIIKFLDSDTFKNIKEVIIPNAVKALNFLKNRILIPLGGLIKTGFTNAFQFIKDNQETINAGLKTVGDIASFLGTNLVVGFKFAFGKLADFFFGREVAVGPGGQFRERTGQGLFGKIGGVINFFRNLPDTIATQFTNIMEKIKGFFDYVFSFDILADIYDRIIGPFFPNTPNPFRNTGGFGGGFGEGQSNVSSSTLMGDAARTNAGQEFANVINTITDGTIAQQVQRAMNMMRQASGDIDDLGTLGVAPLIPLINTPPTLEDLGTFEVTPSIPPINTDKLLEQSRAISSLATPGEIASFVKFEKLAMDLQKFSNPMNLDMGAKVESDFSKVITITPMDKFIGEGGGAFMVTQNNVDASSQKFESNHPQYVTDQDNFLSHATSSVGGFHHR